MKTRLKTGMENFLPTLLMTQVVKLDANVVERHTSYFVSSGGRIIYSSAVFFVTVATGRFINCCKIEKSINRY